MKNILFTLLVIFAISSNAQIKKVIIEDYTGAWCGYCPDGALIMQDIIHTNDPNVIGIAVHNGDVLEVPDGTTLDVGFGVSSYPSGTIDRFKFSDISNVQMPRNQWITKTSSRTSEAAIVSISFNNLTFDTLTRIFDVDVSAVFTAGDASTLPKTINLGLVEDSIRATVGTDLEQSNYISSIGGSILDPWYHNHTLRDWLSGAWGQGAVIPNSPNIGDVYTQHYTYTLPVDWNFNQMHLVAYVAHNGTTRFERDIMNAESMKLYTPEVNTTGIIDNKNNINNIQVYPNPSTDITNIQFDLEKSTDVNIDIYDILGNKVANSINTFYNAGTHTLNIELVNQKGNKLSSGLYMLKFSSIFGTTTTKIQIK